MSENNQSNPLILRAKVPGQTFTMPSGGIFYTHDELDGSVKNGEVVVSPMVTMDELIIKTPDKLLNGTAIAEVFQRCIPQILKPNQLLAKDVDFLLICLRKVTYGPQYEIEYTHDCESATKHNYLIPLDSLISGAKKLDKASAVQDYTLTLDNGQVVKLSPPKYYQMLMFYQSFNQDITDQERYNQLMDATTSVVDTVDGTDNKEFIAEWARSVPAGFTRKIGDKVAELSTWGPNLKTEIVCHDCKEKVELDISLNPTHFFS